MQDLSQQCVRFASTLNLREVPEAVVDHAKQCVLDWLGCAICGSVQEPAAIIREYADFMGGSAQAGILGRPGLTSLYNAALANGYYGHILEMDDVDKPSISHPGTLVIPAALSVGQWSRASGGAFLQAVIAGYEVMLRIGSAVTPGHYRIWHTTATTGVFGSVVAAGLLLGLDAKRLGWAFGNAGTMSAGLWEFLRDNAMSKYLHAGHGAAAGVKAACLAKFGLTGPSRILEGTQGFFAGYARQDVDETLFDDFGARFRTAGVSFKPYPSCRHTHSSIDCARTIHGKLAGRQDEIAAVAIEVYAQALQVANVERAVDARQAQFSLKHCVAAALLRGNVVKTDFEGANLADPGLEALKSRMTVAGAADLDGLTPAAWPARVRVTLHGGECFQEEVRNPKGDPENPLTWDELADKFRLLVRDIVPEKTAESLVDMCRRLETLEHCGTLIRKVAGNE
jgi:2-methylcitrate dehydratase PrpD